MVQLCIISRIEELMSVLYHFGANCLAEKFNGTMGTRSHKCVTQHSKTFLSYLLFSYWTVPYPSLEFYPLSLFIGGKSKALCT